MDRLHLRFLLFALDDKTYQYSKSLPDVISLPINRSDIDESSHDFRTPVFNIISRRKMEAVYELLNMGCNVIFIDVDVVVLLDPMVLFSWENVDYIFSVNKICGKDNYVQWDFWSSTSEEGNTGFYFARSNQKVLKISLQFYDSLGREETLLKINEDSSWLNRSGFSLEEPLKRNEAIWGIYASRSFV
eukprot:gene8706-17989_t